MFADIYVLFVAELFNCVVQWMYTRENDDSERNFYYLLSFTSDPTTLCGYISRK